MKEVHPQNVTRLGAAQARPMSFQSSVPRGVQRIKIDTAVRINDVVALTGWCTDPDVEISLVSGGIVFFGALRRFDRKDVRKALGMHECEQLGFGLICDCVPDNGAILRIGSAADPFDLGMELTVEPDPAAISHFTPFVFSCLADLPIGSTEWKQRLALMPLVAHDAKNLVGHIDLALQTHSGGVVSGWEIHDEKTLIWLEDGKGQAYDLGRAYRYFRPDVHSREIQISRGPDKAGFLCDIPRTTRNAAFRLCGCTQDGRFSMGQFPAKKIAGGSVSVARSLFDINTPRLDLPARMRKIDLPLLGRIKTRELAARHGIKPEIRSIGPPVENPEISVIVPLYGRVDMVEHQLLEFCKDPDFDEKSEIIYVVDDPEIGPGFASLARCWHDICGPSFRVVSAGDNRGFSGACNLGASVAKGDTLIFLNSDVIPIRPGWASALVGAMQSNPKIAMIAPRLLFPDGSIQHAGMSPRWRDALGLWTNHHPLMGMDPADDPAIGVTLTPLITGACVAIGKSCFDDLGGWNTDYLIGDFEDSDLCFRILAKGQEVAYCPDIELTHLERQSVVTTGEDHFRDRLTILNATLFNARWAKMLRDLAK